MAHYVARCVACKGENENRPGSADYSLSFPLSKIIEKNEEHSDINNSAYIINLKVSHFEMMINSCNFKLGDINHRNINNI